MKQVGLPILTYHAIDTSGSVISTDPHWFAETMARFHDAGWRAIDLQDWRRLGRPAVERGFGLTFDDGLRSTLPAFDVLKRYGFHATVFLVTSRVGRTNAWPGQRADVPLADLLSWTEIMDLQASGVSFGSHSATHPNLSRLDAVALEYELRGSRETLEQRLGVACPLFAYPYGASSARARHVASRSYETAFTTRPACTHRGDDPFRLSRFDAFDLRSCRRVEELLDGTLERSLRVRRSIRAARGLALSWVGVRV
jgi:peptidoglycan/xylan/chitin deacetylase (PgdA/CDA1 family)